MTSFFFLVLIVEVREIYLYLSFCTYLSMFLYIYIYCHSQTDCFVVSQLFSVARYVGRLKPTSVPRQLGNYKVLSSSVRLFTFYTLPDTRVLNSFEESHPQTDCFVVSQLFSVDRHARFSLGSKPSWFIHQPKILPHSHEKTCVRIVNAYVSLLFCFYVYPLNGYQELNSFEGPCLMWVANVSSFARELNIYIYICVSWEFQVTNTLSSKEINIHKMLSLTIHSFAKKNT